MYELAGGQGGEVAGGGWIVGKSKQVHNELRGGMKK